ncbi:RE1-silencing transcription factor-like isoform X2 [Plectropomus leopardus]|uniref:RE1-silencing transcription factor-like isoform X2 n=1 Tax=Plectropomus leopardus TaxID=160734 RepID=UPI001C4BBD46|nr:RE1-silencing transcription factor-like isoform X2 [Plectropomus leopardus]
MAGSQCNNHGTTGAAPRMCSVVGCDSWRRSAQMFKLPEDPESRLEWVQFIFEVNGQRLKESSWTDITICIEHFTDDSFEHLTPATGTVQLKPSAVPSLCVKSEPEDPLESPQYVEPVETKHADGSCDDPNPPTSRSKKSRTTSKGSQARPLSSGVLMSKRPNASNAVTSGSDLMQQKLPNIELNSEKAALLQTSGKYAVNESCLLQLFRRKCPSCGFKLLFEKVTYGVLIVLKQQCLKCDYKNQWKSLVDYTLPAAVNQHLTGGTEVTTETQQEMPTDDNPSSTVFSEIVTFSDEESDLSDEGEEGDEGEVSSDGDWNPTGDILLAEELAKQSEEESEDEDELEEEEENSDTPGGLKINELCTECGSFFNILKPHTCEHKVKPFSCNICGKRCVTETSLKNHSKIHDETYEHPCKYCYVTFKTRVDKLKHEQTHQDEKEPYKCPDCPKTFASSKVRKVHLANHRTDPKVYKCGVCGIEFKDVHHLRRHSVVHTGLKPYKCSVCERGFNQSSHLKSHMRLHTGERPFKCRHCDKRFNHNVSLKSHVQRYHSSSSGREQKRDKTDENASDTGDAEDSGKKRGTDSEFDNTEEVREETVQREIPEVRKSKKRTTGRPRGRPKRDAAGNLIPAGQTEGQRSNTKTAKSKAKKFKKTGSSDEESEDEQSDSDMSFGSAGEEEEEEEEETARKITGRSRGKPKNDSDSDFDPEEEATKKRYGRQSSGKSSGKGRGRPKKNSEENDENA